MRDCLKCPYRVEANWNFKRLKWEDLPCAACVEGEMKKRDPGRPPSRRNTLPYHDGLLAHVRYSFKDGDPKGQQEAMAHVFALWLQLDLDTQVLIKECVFHRDDTVASCCTRLGISRTTYYRQKRQLENTLPELASLLH